MNSGFCSHLVPCLLGIILIKDFFYLRSCPLYILFTLNVCLLEFCPLWSRSVMTFSPHSSSPAVRSFQSGLVHLLFYLFVRRSNWVFVYLDFFYFGVWPDDILSTQDCVHYWFRQLWILLTFGSVYLGFYPTWCLSTWILSTWESCHMTFYPGRIVSTIGSVNSRFCLHVVLSTLESVHLRVWLLGICPLWILAS